MDGSGIALGRRWSLWSKQVFPAEEVSNTLGVSPPIPRDDTEKELSTSKGVRLREDSPTLQPTFLLLDRSGHHLYWDSHVQDGISDQNQSEQETDQSQAEQSLSPGFSHPW
ncbi:unnamed protein product [Lepidochelys olivacea]